MESDRERVTGQAITCDRHCIGHSLKLLNYNQPVVGHYKVYFALPKLPTPSFPSTAQTSLLPFGDRKHYKCKYWFAAIRSPINTNKNIAE